MYAVSTSKRYHHGQLRETLIGLALDMLEGNGPEALTLRGLAQRAGVSGMAPYRHFADKSALVAAVAEAGFEELRQRLLAVDDETDPKAALVAFCVVYVGFANDKPSLFRLMFGGAPPTADERLTDDRQTVFGLMATRIAQLVPPSRRQDALLASWSLAHGLAALLGSGRIRQPIADPGALAARLAKLLLPGLQGR